MFDMGIPQVTMVSNTITMCLCVCIYICMYVCFFFFLTGGTTSHHGFQYEVMHDLDVECIPILRNLCILYIYTRNMYSFESFWVMIL